MNHNLQSTIALVIFVSIIGITLYGLIDAFRQISKIKDEPKI